MGSTCDLSIDGFSIWGTKSYVDDATLSMFHERDRQSRFVTRPQYGSREPEEIIAYIVGAQAMRERLDALGFTVARARSDYARGLSDEYEIYLCEGFTRADRKRIKDWTYDRWCAAIARLSPRGFQVWNAEKFADDSDAERIADDLQSGLGAYFSDVRFLLRGLLDALPQAREVLLDVTDLIDAGYYEVDEPICDAARRGWAHDHSIYGSILLLTEGKTDTRILQAAFEAMAPHLVGLYGFLDFDGLKIEGSADVLAKTIRSFVGARVSSRVIAVFDHDTAGAAAMASLANVALPDHIKVMALPENTLAKSYPTLGPEGPAVMDVNGMACGIEMYLGVDALRDARGELLPIRWTGYNSKLRRYQGAIEDKDGISDRFRDRLRRCSSPHETRQTFPDLANVIDRIAGMFADAPLGHKGPRQNLSRW